MSPATMIDLAVASRSRGGARALASAVLPILDRAKHELDGDLQAAESHLARASSLLQMEIDGRAREDLLAGASGALARWQIRRLLAYIDSHIDRAICVKDLSELVHLSPNYFCRVFKKSFGETVHSYVIGRRLDHAAHLMRWGDAPLSEIALACGFSDQAHLSRLFWRRMGRSPNGWRRERRAQAAPAEVAAPSSAATRTLPRSPEAFR